MTVWLNVRFAGHHPSPSYGGETKPPLQGCLERLQTARWPENFAQNNRATQVLGRRESKGEGPLI
jgi:hypothetical protein